LKKAVIDASVILKWYLVDEKFGIKALRLLGEFVSNELDILAPSLLEYEVMNGLMIAQKKGRIKEEKILAAVEGFVNLGINLKSLSHLYPQVIHFCKTYNRSVYDASYMALALDEGISLITADQGLFNAIKKELKWVKWLGDT
jgi:predicted nucleic acid-binding protein